MIYYNYEHAIVKVINKKEDWRNIKITDIFSKSQKREIVVARQILMYYRMTELKKSSPVAAERYGKNHSTCLHACKKLEFYFRKYSEYKTLYSKFLESINIEFTDKLYEKYSQLDSKLSELYTISCAVNGTFELHEEAMLKHAEVSTLLSDFKKLILEKWKEQ